MYKTEIRGKLIDGDKSMDQISREILAPIDAKTPKWWYAAITVSLILFGWGIYSIYITLTQELEPGGQ
jgi:molybdopterin-containing oxidoreductase family membrane subunit